MGKINASALSSYIERSYTPTSTVQIDDVEITVKKTLSLSEMLSFVDGVVNSCFLEESGEYMPEIKHFAIQHGIIEYYTNIELPEDTQEKYDFLMRSDIIKIISEMIDKEQFMDMMESIDCKIDHISRANISILEKQMVDLQHMVTNMIEKFTGALDGIDMDVLNAINSSYMNGDIHPEKIYQAYKDTQGERG